MQRKVWVLCQFCGLWRTRGTLSYKVKSQQWNHYYSIITTRTTLSSVPGGPLDSSGFPLSLLLIAALVLVFSFLFCGLFLRIGLQYLVRKKDELTRRDEDRGGGDETETLDDSAPSAPPLPTNSFCAPLPPPPTYSEAVASSPPPPKLSSQHPLHVQPPPYSLLIGPSGPCLARSYTANNSWHGISWQSCKIFTPIISVQLNLPPKKVRESQQVFDIQSIKWA